ncbi:UNVERIFIED_ORG: ABC-type oligopeptide transport system ATPase subunit [Arthrobacter sp. UYEF10]
MFTNPQHRYTQSLIKATPNFRLASTPLTGTPASGEQPHDPAQRGLLPVRSL